MSIRFFDMFSGIGGFRSGLERIGGFECIGHCEIDKYANQAYNAIYEPKGEIYYEDARTINPNELPDIDLICAGFPCQAFSIAGLRGGFNDSRGTLFFEIARIAAVKRPPFCYLKMFPDSYRMTAAGRLRPSSLRFLNWGTMSHGKCLTARISEFPNPERECILSDILENDVPEKYFLSQSQMLRLLNKSFPDVKVTEFTQQTESQSLSQVTPEDSEVKPDYTK